MRKRKLEIISLLTVFPSGGDICTGFLLSEEGPKETFTKEHEFFVNFLAFDAWAKRHTSGTNETVKDFLFF